MQQNYTIFLKNCPLNVVYDKDIQGEVRIKTTYSTIDLLPDAKLHKKLKECIEDMLNGKIPFADIITDNTAWLMQMVATCFEQQIAAAGGTVFNANNELLCIFRRGYWDLPKGKVETKDGETIEQAALREVEEETGLKHLHIVQPLVNTYHVYDDWGPTLLKTTHWFVMRADDTKLVPQAEEDITRAEWVAPQQMNMVYQNTYENIKFVIAEALKKMPAK